MLKVSGTDAPSIDRWRGDVPAELALVVGRMLQRDRDLRYRTLAEVAVDLLPFGPERRAEASAERIIRVLEAGALSVGSDGLPSGLPASHRFLPALPHRDDEGRPDDAGCEPHGGLPSRTLQTKPKRAVVAALVCSRWVLPWWWVRASGSFQSRRGAEEAAAGPDGCSKRTRRRRRASSDCPSLGAVPGGRSRRGHVARSARCRTGGEARAGAAKQRSCWKLQRRRRSPLCAPKRRAPSRHHPRQRHNNLRRVSTPNPRRSAAGSGLICSERSAEGRGVSAFG